MSTAVESQLSELRESLGSFFRVQLKEASCLAVSPACEVWETAFFLLRYLQRAIIPGAGAWTNFRVETQ